MRTAFWIAWRELKGHRAGFLTSLCLVAVAVALCIGSELLSRSREIALGAEIDGIGAPIRLVPAGTTQAEASRLDFGGKLLSPALRVELFARFPDTFRAAEERLILRIPVNGIELPVIGIDGGTPNEPGLALGALAAERLGKAPGDFLDLFGERFQIASIRPSSASAEDLAVFVSRARLQSISRSPSSLNELRLYILPGIEPGKLGLLVRERFPDVSTLIQDRGSVAEQEAPETLSKHRFVIYAITALIAVSSLFLGALLNLRERAQELGTLVAIGASRLMIFKTLLMRSLLVSLLGASSGFLLAAGTTIATTRSSGQELGAVLLLRGSLDLLLYALISALLLSMAAVGPMLWLAGRRWNGYE